MLVILLLAVVQLSATHVTITVDPTSGNDSSCWSIQELQAANLSFRSMSCRTINKALGDTENVSTCDTLQFCSLGLLDGVDGVTIELVDGEHILEDCTSITQSSTIRFVAVTESKATIKCGASSARFNNLYVCGVQNISFHGINFEECGSNSSNVFFRESSDITFQRCTFSKNTGSPLQFRNSTGIEIAECTFTENFNEASVDPDTEDTTLTDTYGDITTSGCVTVFVGDQPIDLVIRDSNFTSNNASRNPENNTRPVLLKSSGHGGALFIRLVGSAGSSIVINDCTFESNFAEVDGGAVYISLSEKSNNNNLTFTNNVFSNNNVEVASGGAISINSFNFTYSNTILIEHTMFISNNGSAGGAFSMALYDSFPNSTRFPDNITFCNCSFLSNSAVNEGTAVGLFSLVHVDQVGFPVQFIDCTFTNNTSLESAMDTSAIAAFRFPTTFSGLCRFEGNIGGGITLLNTRMEVRPNSTLHFFKNQAVFGGGLAMDDRCLLEISSDVHMIFEDNEATESGGGIYVEFPPIRFIVDIFNRLCFLQYKATSGRDVPPQEWKNVIIEFKRNVARLSGAAIFASDMQQCSWLGSNYTQENTLIFHPPPDLLKNFPKYPFRYKNNSLRPEGQNVAILANVNLATSPSDIHVTVDHTLVQPGESLPINLLATDQINNSREAIWSLEAPQREPNLDALSSNNDTYVYDVPPAYQLPGISMSSPSTTQTPPGSPLPPGSRAPPTTGAPTTMATIEENFSSTFSLNFSLLRTLGSVRSLTLNVSGCHPGYGLNATSSTCVCEATSVRDALRCDSNNRNLFLREGTWGGVMDVSGRRQLITVRVQPGYLNCTPQGRLPGCKFKFDDANEQCTTGREGLLCGSCSEDYGVTLDLTRCTSTNCYIGLALFLLLCVTVVIASLLVLLFDIEVPNELKGFIFYAQVIGLVYSPYVVVQTEPTVQTVTNGVRVFLNVLGQSIPLPLCLHQSLKAHYVALLGYISPTLSILCIILFALGSRFIQRLANHSALKGITLLSLFVYKYVADTSLIFISCNISPVGWVFQYDGSQSCSAPDFIVFFIIGLLLVVFFVIPTPFLTSYICIRRPQRFQQYADVLTKGLRTKHRWWGGWDIGRRFAFVSISVIYQYFRPSVVLFFFSLAALMTLIVHLFTKPFEKNYINVIEAAILLNLLMVTVAFLDPANSPVPFQFSTFLVILPYVYAACYIFYSIIGKKLWENVKQRYAVKQEQLKERVGSMGEEKREMSPSTGGHDSNSKKLTNTETDTSSRPWTKTKGSASAEDIDSVPLREPLLDDL